MFSSDSYSRKTRISAHFLDAAPAEGDTVTVEGWLTYYDEKKKSWIPLENARVYIYLDGRELGNAETNSYGMFSFSFPVSFAAKHKLEVRFKGKAGYGVTSKTLEFQVLRREDKKRLGRLTRDIFLLILVMIFLLFLTIFFLKSF
ncbi:hypothetical protein [Archaeoglobus neptunius]|uniref:hypothetical protein n=1 Tax=Archaeoglobus neptunius TaxID=2798580 RepID=UPI0019253981|nr:hypothetical protein [Archaeoglobus neptunius]